MSFSSNIVLAFDIKEFKEKSKKKKFTDFKLVGDFILRIASKNGLLFKKSQI